MGVDREREKREESKKEGAKEREKTTVMTHKGQVISRIGHSTGDSEVIFIYLFLLFLRSIFSCFLRGLLALPC